MLKKSLPFIVILFFLFSLLIFVVASFITSQRTSFFGKATSGPEDTQVSSENSYVFASPLQAQAANVEKIRVTIFILNGQGLGVPGKTVSLNNVSGININTTQSVTDSYGKAIFDISADNGGKYTITARVGLTTLPQTVTVSFN